MDDIAICSATQTHAADACRVLRRSISELCGPDYSSDPVILAEWLSNKTPSNVRDWIEDEKNFAVVAHRNGVVVGFALLRGEEILLNYVVPECLCKGVGHMMLEALESKATSLGLSQLHCVSTITARSFYEGHGFRSSGEPVYVGRILGEFPLRKRIGA